MGLTTAMRVLAALICMLVVGQLAAFLTVGAGGGAGWTLYPPEVMSPLWKVMMTVQGVSSGLGAPGAMLALALILFRLAERS